MPDPPIVPPALRSRAWVRVDLPPYRPNPLAGAGFAAFALGRAGGLPAVTGQVPVITLREAGTMLKESIAQVEEARVGRAVAGLMLGSYCFRLA